MKKNLLAIVFGLAIIFAAYSSINDVSLLRAEVGNGYSVAGCPTHHSLLPGLDNGDFKTVRTASTGESVRLFRREDVDFIISGRKLKPNEPDLESEKLGEGYSFLAESTLSITEDEMADLQFFTDQNPEKLVSEFEGLSKENLKYVEYPYTRIDDGIVITSFENTDYSKGELVHIYDGFGRRVEKTRRPTLFFREEDRDKAEEIINLIKK